MESASSLVVSKKRVLSIHREFSRFNWIEKKKKTLLEGAAKTNGLFLRLIARESQRIRHLILDGKAPPNEVDETRLYSWHLSK